MKNKINKDLFIIVKSVMAQDIKDAIKKEKESRIINVYMDDDWKKNKVNKSDNLGF